MFQSNVIKSPIDNRLAGTEIFRKIQLNMGSHALIDFIIAICNFLNCLSHLKTLKLRQKSHMTQIYSENRYFCAASQFRCAQNCSVAAQNDDYFSIRTQACAFISEPAGFGIVYKHDIKTGFFQQI